VWSSLHGDGSLVIPLPSTWHATLAFLGFYVQHRGLMPSTQQTA
jgi:hypothetical protein